MAAGVVRYSEAIFESVSPLRTRYATALAREPSASLTGGATAGMINSCPGRNSELFPRWFAWVMAAEVTP